MSSPHVVIAAGGSVESAFLPHHLLQLVTDFDVRVTVALSRGAAPFVTRTALRAITGARPYRRAVDWDDDERATPRHLSLSRADLLVLWPATARIVAACAQGLVSCAPTRLFAFTPKPRVVIAPALHPSFERSIYVPHLKTLESLGCEILGGDDLHASWHEVRTAIVARLSPTRRTPHPGVQLLDTMHAHARRRMPPD